MWYCPVNVENLHGLPFVFKYISNANNLYFYDILEYKMFYTMCANGKIGNRKQLPSIKWLDLHSPVKARKHSLIRKGW